jgi:uncharacterized caspase-like protein/ABC-type phosphate transport system substrate-binding protein
MVRNYAITIGINKYYYVRSLSYAVRDADAMSQFFGSEMGFQKVYHFTDKSLPIPQDYGPDQDSRPTGSALRRFLRTRFDQPFLGDGDTLWFFFAGHGVRYEGRDYLMPIDTDLEDLKNSAIPIHYISERLRRSGADNIILLIDACRSYDGRRDGLGIGKEKQQGVITLFSCSPEESSYEIKELEQGAFTYTLLNSLRLQGEGNCATVERLYQRLRYYVPQLTRQYKQVVQTPYGIIEPLSKNHLILLPRQATLSDVETLKKDALTAEVQHKAKEAKQLWIRVLAVSPADPEAIEGIERLLEGVTRPAATSETLPIERKASPISPSPKVSSTIRTDTPYSPTHKKNESASSKKSTDVSQIQRTVSQGSLGSLVNAIKASIQLTSQSYSPLQWFGFVGTVFTIILLRLVIPSQKNFFEKDKSPSSQSSKPSDETSADFSPCTTVSTSTFGFDSISSLPFSSGIPKGKLVSPGSGSLMASISIPVQRNLLAQIIPQQPNGVPQVPVTPLYPSSDNVLQVPKVKISSTSDSSMACANKALKLAFEAKFLGAQVVITPENNGTDTVIQNILTGNADLAAIGRPLTEQEKSEGLIAVDVLREKIALFVSSENPFNESLSASQFGQIFRGEIIDWSEVGGLPGAIRFIDHPENSDTRKTLRAYPVFVVAPFSNGATVDSMRSDDIEAIISALGKDGISYAPVSQVIGNPSIRILAIHNTLPNDPRYPFSQPYSYVYAGEASPGVASFLRFATSEEGIRAIRGAE